MEDLNQSGTALFADPTEITTRWSGPLAKADMIHRYPAKMALGLADHFLGEIVPSLYPDEPIEDLQFYDPFCGGGTTLLVARTRQYNVCGSDLLPPAVLIARAKITRLSNAALAAMRQELGRNVLSNSEVPLWSWPTMDTWYTRRTVRALQDLRQNAFNEKLREVRAHLAVAVSQTCWDVSGADQEVMVPTHSTRAIDIPNHTPCQVLEAYRRRLKRIIRAQEALAELGVSTKPVRLRTCNALDSDSWPKKTDVVLTSPPYGLGIDYVRASSLQWRILFPDIDMSTARTQMLGRRNNIVRHGRNVPNLEGEIWYQRGKKNDPPRLAAFLQYLSDLRKFLVIARRKINSNGILGLVLGNPETSRTRIPLAEIARTIALDVGFVEAVAPVRDKIRRRFQAGQRRSSAAPITDETLLCLRAP